MEKLSQYVLLAGVMSTLVACHNPANEPGPTQVSSTQAVASSSAPVVKATVEKPKRLSKLTDALQRRAYAFALSGDVLFGGTTAGVVAWKLDRASGRRSKLAELVLAGSVQNMKVFPGGEMLVSTGPTGLARVDIRHVADGKLALRGHHPWSSAARQGCFSVWQAAPTGKPNHAVLACGTGGVGMARWGDRQDDVVVSSTLDVGGYVRDVVLVPQNDSKKAVVAAAAGRAGVVLLDVSGGKLRVLSKVAIDGEARALASTGGLVYVAAGTAGLQILDASNPKTARVIGHFSPELTDKARGIAIDPAFFCVDCLGSKGPGQAKFTDRQVAYLCAGEAGLWAVDVRRPSRPELLGRYNPKRAMNRAVVKGDRLYAANDDGGVLVLNIENPKKLEVVK